MPWHISPLPKPERRKHESDLFTSIAGQRIGQAARDGRTTLFRIEGAARAAIGVDCGIVGCVRGGIV